MGTPAPGSEAPFKYTKDSFIGLKDAWLGFAADRLSKAAAALEQYTEKLPDSVKSKLPKMSKAAAGENGSSDMSATS